MSRQKKGTVLLVASIQASLQGGAVKPGDRKEVLTYEELARLAEELSAKVKQQAEWLKQQDEQIENLQKGQEDMMNSVRQFIRNLPFGLILVRQNQTIKAANNTAAECFQYSKDELAEQSIKIIFPGNERLEVTTQPQRLTALKKGGESFAVDVSVNRLDMRGEQLLFVSVLDVNERHRLEQLRRDLMAMVSHDLRAPLTAVRVTLEMMLEGVYGELNDRGSALLAQAVTSVEYLNTLVEGLLEAEKAEDGNIELEYSETTIGKLIKSAVNTVYQDQAATVKVETDFTNDSILVDEQRIVQVLINLISNAIKYSPANGVVTIHGGIDRLHAKFVVADQGPGIPEDKQIAIFDRYSQLAQPGGKKRKGFGLGLAICKALVERHKGRIWVESKPGEGSRFCFSVPMSPDTKH